MSLRVRFLSVLSLAFFGLTLCSTLFGACVCPPPVGCAQQPTGPCATPPGSTYILRYSNVGVHGQMTFIGNTLGLSKAVCVNDRGQSDAIGAFTTIDPTQMVGTYPSLTVGAGSPAGTTTDWTKNSSSAVLNIPAGSTILYAELVWSGSYGYYCEDSDIGVDPNCILISANGPITFITADGVTHSITSDPATRLISQNPSATPQQFFCAGNYLRSANVTSLFSAPSLANPNGTYTVAGVPATISPFDNTQNAAGWTLAVVYQDLTNLEINNMSLYVSNQQGSNATAVPAQVSGFCAAPAQTFDQSARVLVSGIEGDANKMGDHFQFAPTIPQLSLPAFQLFGPNNPVTNFFCSQINDDLGNLINTTGTFCIFNADPFTGVLFNGGRQGYDITNVDASSTIMPNQTTAFARATTTGDDYMVNALGIQISVDAPVIVPMKLVDGQTGISAQIGDTVTFTISIDNTSGADAINVVFSDLVESGLMYVPNTFKVNNVPAGNPDLSVGVNLGTIPMMTTVLVEFEVMIIGPPPSGNMFVNSGTATFEYFACSAEQPFFGSNMSNVVTITLPNPILLEPPTNFNGTVKNCAFLNKSKPSLRATWDPALSPNVVSYLILENGQVVATIPATGPYVFETCLQSQKEAKNFSIISLFPNNMQSAPLNIRITHE